MCWLIGSLPTQETKFPEIQMNVLIIEDDLIIAQNLKESLEEVGYVVTAIVQNYSQAAQQLSTNRPDVCLVDIYLKGSEKNGIEIVEEFRSSVDIPYVYLTSFGDNEYRHKIKATNPAGYLLKPASTQQVDVAIDFAVTNFLKSKAGAISKSQVGKTCPLYSENDMLFVRTNGRYSKVMQSEIIYIQAAGAYCYLICHSTKTVITTNLKNLLEQLTDSKIFKCHRSYAVNQRYIHSFDDSCLYLEQGKEITEIPISRRLRESVMIRLPKLKA